MVAVVLVVASSANVADVVVVVDEEEEEEEEELTACEVLMGGRSKVQRAQCINDPSFSHWQNGHVHLHVCGRIGTGNAGPSTNQWQHGHRSYLSCPTSHWFSERLEVSLHSLQ